MVSRKIMEGTGKEISEYAKAHPGERFVLSETASNAPATFDELKWDNAMKVIRSFRGKFRVLPDEASSTESLYD